MPETMPIWVEMLLNNSAAYGDFVRHIGMKMTSHEQAMEAYVRTGNIAAAQAELGSKTTYAELFNELTIYETELQSQIQYQQTG